MWRRDSSWDKHAGILTAGNITDIQAHDGSVCVYVCVCLTHFKGSDDQSRDGDGQTAEEAASQTPLEAQPERSLLKACTLLQTSRQTSRLSTVDLQSLL